MILCVDVDVWCGWYVVVCDGIEFGVVVVREEYVVVC